MSDPLDPVRLDERHSVEYLDLLERQGEQRRAYKRAESDVRAGAEARLARRRDRDFIERMKARRKSKSDPKGDQ